MLPGSVAETLKLHLRKVTREERATAETIVIICKVIYNKYAKKKNNSFVDMQNKGITLAEKFVRVCENKTLNTSNV